MRRHHKKNLLNDLSRFFYVDFLSGKQISYPHLFLASN